jgi:phosphinothricin acetyltransferase
MKFYLRPLTADDRRPVMDIFNHYVESSFAAYPEEKLPDEFYDLLFQKSEGCPRIVAADEKGIVLGFGLLHPHHPFPTFAGTMESTYFIAPETTGRGIGTQMLDHLLQDAKEKGIHTVLAGVSSLNEASIRFHKKNGFEECGRFRSVGLKKGTRFDVVWLQRFL